VSDKKIPHKGLVTVEYKIYPQMPDAYFNPMSVINGSLLLSVDGDSQNECEEKIQEKLEEIRSLKW
jgi:hypothetical protein|tara:strand:+ start:162 stop:359 length:198 start_codon:yes stop_codon:yes gene_type:complete